MDYFPDDMNKIVPAVHECASLMPFQIEHFLWAIFNIYYQNGSRANYMYKLYENIVGKPMIQRNISFNDTKTDVISKMVNAFKTANQDPEIIIILQRIVMPALYLCIIKKIELDHYKKFVAWALMEAAGKKIDESVNSNSKDGIRPAVKSIKRLCTERTFNVLQVH